LKAGLLEDTYIMSLVFSSLTPRITKIDSVDGLKSSVSTHKIIS
jgi:hypothetical protein